MTIQEEAKRVKAGQSLTDLENQLQSALAQVEAIKINIKKLKVEMGKDPVFTADDITAIDAKITKLKI